jgi:hypothetical protein
VAAVSKGTAALFFRRVTGPAPSQAPPLAV